MTTTTRFKLTAYAPTGSGTYQVMQSNFLASKFWQENAPNLRSAYAPMNCYHTGYDERVIKSAVVVAKPVRRCLACCELLKKPTGSVFCWPCLRR